MLSRPATVEERRTHPRIENGHPFKSQFYRGQRQAFHMLPALRLGVYFIHGEKSPISWPGMRKARVESCGKKYGVMVAWRLGG
jgi:hypothetical protein